MILLLCLFTTVYSAAILDDNSASATLPDDCQACDLKQCTPLKPEECYSGIVRDRCGCCSICALEEGHLCTMRRFEIANVPVAMRKYATDRDPSFLNVKSIASLTQMVENNKNFYGYCGDGLECRVRHDIDKQRIGSQSICYCIEQGPVCGTDGNTYSSCQMEAQKKRSNGTISMLSRGPCKKGATVVSIADDQVVALNSRVSLLCEVEGYPMPSVEWIHINAQTGQKTKLPGDSENISVSVRGGPQAMRITSHLQITDVQLDNEGEYICDANNDMGLTTKTVRLIVDPMKIAKTQL